MPEAVWYQRKITQLVLCILLVALGVFLYIYKDAIIQQDNQDEWPVYLGLLVSFLGVLPALFLWRDAEEELHKSPSWLTYVARIFIFIPLRVVLGLTCFVFAFFLMSKGRWWRGPSKGLGGILVGILFYLLFLIAVFFLVYLIARIAKEDWDKIDENFPPMIGFIIGWRIIKRAFVWPGKDENVLKNSGALVEPDDAVDQVFPQTINLEKGGKEDVGKLKECLDEEKMKFEKSNQEKTQKNENGFALEPQQQFGNIEMGSASSQVPVQEMRNYAAYFEKTAKKK